jgi:aminoglycoside 3-N-acetyltransferase
MSKYVTEDVIVQELKRAGIQPADNLIVHSSLKSLGYVDGGAQTVITALLRAIGPEGTLMMPTFTFSLPMWNMPPYEKATSPSRVGRITEAFRQMPGVLRSDHPSHSVAAFGPLAEELTRDHLHCTPLGLDSPFDKFYRRGGKILMLGTRQDTNSILHLSEVRAGVPYLDVAFTHGQNFEIAAMKNEKGEVVEVRIYQVPGCSRGFTQCEPYLRKEGVLKDVTICKSRSQLLDVKSLVEAMVRKLGEEPDLLLCHTAECGICPRRREAARSGRGPHDRVRKAKER